MPSRSAALLQVGSYRPPTTDDATLLAQLLAGPVRVERDCRSCVQRGCEPIACETAQQFEAAVERLRTLERHGFVTVWVRGYYAPTPGGPATARARLTDAGRTLAESLATPTEAPAVAAVPRAASAAQGAAGTTRTTRPFASSVTR